MDYKFIIDSFFINDFEMDISVRGETYYTDKLMVPRITTVFSAKEEERILPLELKTVIPQNGKSICFIGSMRYDLRYVFQNISSLEDFKVGFSISDGYENAIKADFFMSETVMLPEETKKNQNNIICSLDSRKYQKRSSMVFNIYRVIAFILCILLLPLFLLDGYFAYMGFKEPEEQAKKKSGKKMILYHASALTRRISGFAYSVREWKTGFLALCYRLYSKKQIVKNKILYLSEREKGLSGNFAFVKKYLPEKEYIVEEFNDSRTVDRLSLPVLARLAKQAAQARIIVLDDFYPQIHSICLKKETKLLQLWHACGAFKTFGFSRLNKQGGPEQDSSNHRSYDYAMVSGTGIADIYSEAFGISPEKVKPLGVPRTDIFFDDDYKKTIREMLGKKYPVLKGKKVILFAPTFRGDGKKDAFYPAGKFHPDFLLDKLPKEYILVIKNHPFVKKEFAVSAQNRHRVLDLTNRENVNDLLFITDTLITDYSSVIFEASLLHIPMIFYVFDLAAYLEERDVYFDFINFVPGSIVQKEEELPQKILAQDSDTEKEKLFHDKFLDALDGCSGKRIADFIMELCENTFD